MDPIEYAIVEILKASAPVKALAVDRITPLLRTPDADVPAIVYQLIGGTSADSKSGHGGLTFSRYQIKSYGTTSDQAWALDEVVRLAMIAVRNADFEGGIHITTVLPAGSPRDGIDTDVKGGENHTYWRTRDFRIGHKTARAV